MDATTRPSSLPSYRSKILGTGSYLPERRLTNQDLERIVDTSDAWIVERTGIRTRRIAAPGEQMTDLAHKASVRALQAAGLGAGDIDGIICATVTSERVLPAAACVLQAKLGCRPLMAFDVSAACSGFIYALNLADSLIRCGSHRSILVVGAETLSRIMDYRDRETCILFGDGAGAFVVGRADSAEQGRRTGRLLSFHLGADGTVGDHLTLDGLTKRRPSPVPAAALAAPLAIDASLALAEADRTELSASGPFVQMRGREIFRCAVKAMGERCEEALQANSTSIDQVDWFIPHQANIRIIEAVGRQIDARMDRVISNLAEVGNTSSASIPLALDEAIRDGRVQRGQLLLLAAFGGGLTSAAGLLRY